jgi:hypothetical protein
VDARDGAGGLKPDEPGREFRGGLLLGKRDLSLRYAQDRIGYTDAKAPFIKETLSQAEAWAAPTGWSP